MPATQRPLLSWLDPLNIQSTPEGYRVPGVHGEPVTTTFEVIVNSISPRGHGLPRRIPEIRNALAHTLRYAHCPALVGQGPWRPTAARYQPFRTTIGPLLDHPIWQSANVIAAPDLLYLPARPIAGSVDVILQLADGSIAIAGLYCCRHQPALTPAVRTELGGFIAAVCDTRRLVPQHAMAIWAGPDETIVETHHPDICLGLWVDAIDQHNFNARLNAPPGDQHPAEQQRNGNAARDHPSADLPRP